MTFVAVFKYCIVNTIMKKKSYNTSNYSIVLALFVTTVLVSNIASTKLFSIHSLTIDGGTILFPLAYIVSDIITEVYGFRAAKRAIITGFFMSIIMALTLFLVQLLPPATDWGGQDAYEQILGLLPRVIAGSLIAYTVGELTNSFIMAKMKIASNGKHLWTRTIGSSIVAAFLDTLIFSTIAFYGIVPIDVLISLIVTVYIIKILVEVAITPFTYAIVNHLKKVDKQDHYDTDLALIDIIKD